MILDYPLILVAALLWIGFISAISFMEAWLKFRAPGITLALGLGIGRIVFSALNKMEWLFAIVILFHLIFANIPLFEFQSAFYFLSLLLLLIQTVWILPALDKRAEMHIQAVNVPKSNLHFVYVGMEIIKLICLTYFAFLQFKTETL